MRSPMMAHYGRDCARLDGECRCTSWRQCITSNCGDNRSLAALAPLPHRQPFMSNKSTIVAMLMMKMMHLTRWMSRLSSCYHTRAALDTRAAT